MIKKNKDEEIETNISEKTEPEKEPEKEEQPTDPYKLVELRDYVDPNHMPAHYGEEGKEELILYPSYMGIYQNSNNVLAVAVMLSKDGTFVPANVISGFKGFYPLSVAIKQYEQKEKDMKEIARRLTNAQR